MAYIEIKLEGFSLKLARPNFYRWTEFTQKLLLKSLQSNQIKNISMHRKDDNCN